MAVSTHYVGWVNLTDKFLDREILPKSFISAFPCIDRWINSSSLGTFCSHFVLCEFIYFVPILKSLFRCTFVDVEF